jgi:hypothetical protein
MIKHGSSEALRPSYAWQRSKQFISHVLRHLSASLQPCTVAVAVPQLLSYKAEKQRKGPTIVQRFLVDNSIIQPGSTCANPLAIN